MERATHEQQILQALGSPNASRFLTQLASYLVVFARSAYLPDGLNLENEERGRYLREFMELLYEVHLELDRALHSPAAIDDPEALADRLISFRPHDKIRSEWIIDRALSSSGWLCPYCGNWDGGYPRACPSCERQAMTTEAAVAELLRTVQVELSGSMSDSDEELRDAVEPMIEGDLMESAIVVSDFVDDDGDRWVNLLLPAAPAFYFVSKPKGGQWTIEEVALSEDEQPFVDRYVASFNERPG